MVSFVTVFFVHAFVLALQYNQKLRVETIIQYVQYILAWELVTSIIDSFIIFCFML